MMFCTSVEAVTRVSKGVTANYTHPISLPTSHRVPVPRKIKANLTGANKKRAS